jgi:large subunit ribosomal protein L33
MLQVGWRVAARPVTLGALRKRSVPDTKRISIALCCSVCSARNYKKTKARKDGGRPLQLKKFCNTCNAHTVHIEGK